MPTCPILRHYIPRHRLGGGGHNARDGGCIRVTARHHFAASCRTRICACAQPRGILGVGVTVSQYQLRLAAAPPSTPSTPSDLGRLYHQAREILRLACWTAVRATAEV